MEDPEPLLYGAEQIYRNSKRVGYILSGAFGFTLGGSVGLGFVEDDEAITADYIASGNFEIEIEGKYYKAKASLRPLYDPKRERVK